MTDFDAITLEMAQASPSRKWNYYERDVIPSWIADMDFPVAGPIRDFIQSIADAIGEWHDYRMAVSSLETFIDGHDKQEHKRYRKCLDTLHDSISSRQEDIINALDILTKR